MTAALVEPCSSDSGKRHFLSGRRLAWLIALTAPVCVGPAWALALGYFLPGHPLATVTGAVLLLLLGACTWTDLTEGKVRNWATYPAFFWALAINAGASLWGADPGDAPVHGLLGAVGLGPCLLGAGLCFGAMLMIYRLAGGGAGDVKLVAGIGALLGPERGFNAMLVSYIIAAVAIISWVIWMIGPVALVKSCVRKAGSMLFPLWVERPTFAQEKLLKKPVRLACFFALGTLAVLAGVTSQW